LFVEDDPDTGNMLRLCFQSQGYEVMQASWGKDGIEMSHRNPPDLAVLDIRLPDIEQTVPILSISIGSVSENDDKFREVKDIIATVMAQQTTVAEIPEGNSP